MKTRRKKHEDKSGQENTAHAATHGAVGLATQVALQAAGGGGNAMALAAMQQTVSQTSGSQQTNNVLRGPWAANPLLWAQGPERAEAGGEHQAEPVSFSTPEEEHRTAYLGGKESGPASTSVQMNFDRQGQPHWTAERFATDTLRTNLSMVSQMSMALSTFETIINASSLAEAKEKEAGLIAIEHVTKAVGSKVLDIATDLVPGGKIAKDLQSLLTGIHADIEKERKRAASASASNALGQFISDLRDRLSIKMGSIMRNTTDDAISVQQKYDRMSNVRNQAAYLRQLDYQNQYVDAVAQAEFNPKALFARLATAWINNSTKEGTDEASYVLIEMDSSWSVEKAELQCPRGSRIAERLQANAGQFDVNAMPVKRVVAWSPTNSHETWLQATVNPDGSYTHIEARGNKATMMLRTYSDAFNRKLTEGIPPVVNLTGTQTR